MGEPDVGAQRGNGRRRAQGRAHTRGVCGALLARTGKVCAAFVAAAVALVVGCSDGADGNDPSTASSASSAEEPGATTCATTVEAINGHRCARASLFCTVPITCGSFEQQARCDCVGNRFVCVDSTGTIPPGSPPRCVANAPADDDPCAKSLDAADGAPCDTIGKLCFYEGAKCPERPVRNLDYCRCARTTSGNMAFACTRIACDTMLAP